VWGVLVLSASWGGLVADFVWDCLPPRGRSSGILLGVNAAVFDISFVVEGAL